MNQLRERIERVGQLYVDEPIVATPWKPSAIEASVAAAFGVKAQKKPIVVGHERVRLRWMKPDGKGGLVPK